MTDSHQRKEYMRIYRKNNLKKFALSQKKYIKRNSSNPAFLKKLKVKSQQNKQQSRDCNRRLREASLNILGNKCVKCGFSDARALQVDHINGGGSLDREIKGGNYFKRVINSVIAKENKYQLLCANCNWIKRFENNEVRKSKFNN